MKWHSFLWIFLMLAGLVPMAAQPYLDEDEGNLFYSGTVEDFIVPIGITSISFEVRGGAGGSALTTGGAGCSAPGGEGAIASAVFTVGNGPQDIPPCSTIRFVVGEAGASMNSLTIVGIGSSVGGGGGGSAVLFRPPGSSEFSLLLVAGGGGGAYQGVFAGVCVDNKPGQGGRSSTNGGNGSANTDPGVGGSAGNGGGGGYSAGGGGGRFSGGGNLPCPGGADFLGGQAGIVTGGAGGVINCSFFSSSESSQGGFGFGGGGAALIGGLITGGAAGGGGGFSGGGGGGFVGGGGGGGSFVNLSLASQISITAGGSTFNPASGLISYTCTGQPRLFSIFCKNHTVALNEGDFAIINSNNVLSEIVSNCEGLGPISISRTLFDCDDLGSTVVSVTVSNGNNTQTATCSSLITVVDNSPPELTCPPDQTLVLNENCTALCPDFTHLAEVTDNCGVSSIVQSPLPGSLLSGVGTITVSLTAKNRNNVATTCTFNVHKIDNTPPEVLCFDQTLTFNGEDHFILDANVLVDAADACGIESIQLSTDLVTCAQVGQTIPTTATITDINGNVSSCISQITLRGLPCGFSQLPDGVNCTGGSSVDFNASSGVFTLTSTNCYYSNPFRSDALAFAEYQLCGDGSITAHVTGITGTSSGWAGLVMREDNGPGAKKIQLTAHLAGNLLRREIRSLTNGPAYPQSMQAQGRFWLRLVRQGNQFTGFTSANGQVWTPVMSANVGMAHCIDIGLVATNFQFNSQVRATFAQVSIVDNTSNLTLASTTSKAAPATVSIHPNPSKGQLSVDLSAYPTQRLVLYICDVRGTLLAQKTVDTGEAVLQNLDLSVHPPGVYYLRIRAKDSQGEVVRIVMQ
jgi:hypothetical protein